MKLVNTVHDSIVADCHIGEIDDFVELSTDIMVHVVDWANNYMPHVDFSWLISPLAVDVEVGTHYGSLEEYEKS